MHFETVIGLEVHVELKTDSKMFSPSPAHFGAEPNSNTNVIDLAYPGVLPVVNKRAVDWAMRAAMALNMEIATESKFDRKNYFYPDNPKAYQISQFDQPIGEYSLVDLNRQGTPLIEIVSEPDIRSPKEAYAYLEKLRSIIQYTGVSDVKMEEGSLRCDANISLRPYGQEKFGTKAELKNLNSFNYVRKGLEYEEKRQEEELLNGGEIGQETRRFDESTGKTILMRVKEGSDDYRYFPEPDIVPLYIDDAWKERVRQTIPELPDERKAKYVNELGLPAYDAHVLTLTKEMSDFFESTIEHGADVKLTSNWLMGGVNEYLNKNQVELLDTKLTPENLAGMIKLIEDGTMSSKIAKKVFPELAAKGGNAKQIMEDNGLVQISDEATLLKFVNEALDNNEQSVEDYKNGKGKAMGFLVGQIMKASKGQANPQLVNQLLKQELDKR